MTPKEAYQEARHWHESLGVVPPEVESIIASDANYSYLYAYYVLEGRFELGEAAIATSANYSYLYACVILNDRFERGEPAVLNSGDKTNYLNFLLVKGIKL